MNTLKTEPPRAYRWLVLVFISLAMFGNYYIYDSIAPIADILKSDLGLNPSNNGDTIRVPMPPLTEETRREYTKQAKHEAENARVAIRNIRRDANHDLKSLVKEKLISEDDERRGEEIIQKLTDQHVKEVDALLEKKETDLMAI